MKTFFILLWLLLAANISLFPQAQKLGDSTVQYYVIKDSTYTKILKDSVDVEYVIYQGIIGNNLELRRNLTLVFKAKAVIHTELKDQNTVDLLEVLIGDQWHKAWRVLFYKPRNGKVVFL